MNDWMIFGLLGLVCLCGGLIVYLVTRKILKQGPDEAWEGSMVLLLGAGLLIWPVTQALSLSRDAARKELREYRRLVRLDEAGVYRLVNPETGEAMEVVVDTGDGTDARTGAPPPSAEIERSQIPPSGTGQRP